MFILFTREENQTRFQQMSKDLFAVGMQIQGTKGSVHTASQKEKSWEDSMDKEVFHSKRMRWHRFPSELHISTQSLAYGKYLINTLESGIEWG